MKVRTIKETRNTKRHVTGDGFESIRLILASDNMGFSLHKTIIPKGGPYNWHYKNHLESCFCISGKGILKDLSTGESFDIAPDSVYILDDNDNHTFEAIEDIVLISVFNPPVFGSEVHGEDGSYELRAEAEEIVRCVNNCDNLYDSVELVEDILNIKTK